MEKSSNKLVDLSVAFAVEILDLVKYLKSQHETIICNQIGRYECSAMAFEFNVCNLEQRDKSYLCQKSNGR